MAECNWRHGGVCDRIATTTLLRHDGTVRQLCEEHRDESIARLRKIAEEDPSPEVDHWFVLNKIPL